MRRCGSRCWLHNGKASLSYDIKYYSFDIIGELNFWLNVAKLKGITETLKHELEFLVRLHKETQAMRGDNYSILDADYNFIINEIADIKSALKKCGEEK